MSLSISFMNFKINDRFYYDYQLDDCYFNKNR